MLSRAAASNEALIPTSRNSHRGVKGRKVEGVQCVAAVGGATGEVELLGEVVFNTDIFSENCFQIDIILFIFTLFVHWSDFV